MLTRSTFLFTFCCFLIISCEIPSLAQTPTPTSSPTSSPSPSPAPINSVTIRRLKQILRNFGGGCGDCVPTDYLEVNRRYTVSLVPRGNNVMPRGTATIIRGSREIVVEFTTSLRVSQNLFLYVVEPNGRATRLGTIDVRNPSMPIRNTIRNPNLTRFILILSTENNIREISGNTNIVLANAVPENW